MSKLDDLCRSVLKAYATGNPLYFSRAKLLAERALVIDLVTAALAPTPEVAPLEELSEERWRSYEATRIVVAYTGSNFFMQDLQRAIDHYGALTSGQQEAVLSPPEEYQTEKLKGFGVTKMPKYKWQAKDMLDDLNKQARDRRRSTP